MTPKPALLSLPTTHPTPPRHASGLLPVHTHTTITLTQFDRRQYLQLIKARGETIARVVAQLHPLLHLSTALDAGCGVGFFTDTLHHSGLSAAGFDGRMENVAEARHRFPHIPFEQGDIEDAAILQLGAFDLVLCFGLLYHLENPMRAIRHLRALTGKALLLESMCVPGTHPRMLLRDEPAAEDQSLAELALYPSEGCLVKMLYRAGFAQVYRVAPLPDHDDFRDTPDHARRRTVLFASAAPLRGAPELSAWPEPCGLTPKQSGPAPELAGYEYIAEPREQSDPWARVGGYGPDAIAGNTITGAGPHSLAYRLRRFAAKPRRAQYISLAQRARRAFPAMPIPLRLKFGAWWLAEKSALDAELMYGGFEDAEMGFVDKFLRPGMTVLDVGAHHGLYTLLMSKRVGERGKVIAFEPSPRERRRLARHLRVNGCENVVMEPLALGDVAREENLFLVEGQQDWCNSLRPPAVEERTRTVRVNVRPVDDVLEKMGIARVDFIKLDVEGAELSFLRGARRLLRGGSRPAILAEVQDVRTQPWGYAAREIIQFLVREDYCWFAVDADGKLLAVSTELALYDANLVALPQERVAEFQMLLEK